MIPLPNKFLEFHLFFCSICFLFFLSAITYKVFHLFFFWYGFVKKHPFHLYKSQISNFLIAWVSKIVVPVVGSGDLRPLVEAFREDVRDEVGHLSGMKSLNKIPSLKLTFSSLKIGPETPQQGSWKLVFQASIFFVRTVSFRGGTKIHDNFRWFFWINFGRSGSLDF